MKVSDVANLTVAGSLCGITAVLFCFAGWLYPNSNTSILLRIFGLGWLAIAALSLVGAFILLLLLYFKEDCRQ